MSPEEQRIAIAEACGWKSILQTTGYLNDEKFPDTIPDFLNDLNAIHEAEKSLKGEDLWLMTAILTEVVPSEKPIAHATATQRAEAFLKTIGKWKDQ